MGGLGTLITAAIAVVVGLTKLTIEATRFIDALDGLHVRVRQFRRRFKGPPR